MEGVVDLNLVLAPDLEVDLETYHQLTCQLRAELSELEGWSVGAAEDRVVDGVVTEEPVTLGTVSVALGASSEALGNVIETVRGWLSRQSVPHRVVLTVNGDMIQLEGPARDEHRGLVDDFVRRHSVV